MKRSQRSFWPKNLCPRMRLAARAQSARDPWVCFFHLSINAAFLPETFVRPPRLFCPMENKLRQWAFIQYGPAMTWPTHVVDMYLDKPAPWYPQEVIDQYKARNAGQNAQGQTVKKQNVNRGAPEVSQSGLTAFKCPKCTRAFGSLDEFGTHYGTCSGSK